jgi:hypothetical protein
VPRDDDEQTVVERGCGVLAQKIEHLHAAVAPCTGMHAEANHIAAPVVGDACVNLFKFWRDHW